MKKLLAALIVLLMLFLNGCSIYRDIDGEDIFVFSKEGQLYISVKDKIFSKVDKAERSIEYRWIFPKDAYNFSRKVKAPMASPSGSFTNRTETIAFSEKYEMLAKYNGEIYCDIDYLPNLNSYKGINSIIISNTDKIKLKSKSNIIINDKSLLMKFEKILISARNTDYGELQKYKNVHEEERLIGIQYEDIAATLIYGYFGRTAINTIGLCCYDNDPYDLMYPVDEIANEIY